MLGRQIESFEGMVDSAINNKIYILGLDYMTNAGKKALVSKVIFFIEKKS